MTSKNVDLAKHHFLFSSFLFQFLTNQRPNRNSKDQLLLFSAIIVYSLPVVVILLYLLFTTEFILHSNIKLIQKIVAILIMISVYSLFFFRFDTYAFLITRFKLDHEEITDHEELIILQKYTVQSKLYVYILMVFFYVYCFSIIFPSILNVFLLLIGKLKDNQLTLPLTENKFHISGVLYYSILSYQIIFIIIVTVIGSLTFSSFLIFIQHACCQYKITKLKIRQPFKRNLRYKRNYLYFCSKSEEYNWIMNIVNRHQKSIEFVDMLRYVSNEAYFIVVFLAMILSVFNFLCIMQYSELSKNVIDRIEFSMYVIGSFFTIYINFYLGQKLLNYSNAVFAELCNIPFYTISKNTQKLLLFMLMRSGKSSFLSIGNMFISSHEVFASLMRKAFSFAMVYYNVE